MRTQLGPDGLIAKLYEEDIPSIWHFKKYAGDQEAINRYLLILESPWPEVKYELLDDAPTPICDCETGLGQFKAVDAGWTQRADAVWERLDEPDNETGEEFAWIGMTDGWDDMTEGGELQYLVCDICDRAFALPDTNWS